MKEDQRFALSSVKVTHAEADYNDNPRSSYLTAEIGVLLDLLKDKMETLACVREDLECLIDNLKAEASYDSVTMLESVLYLVKDE